VSPAHLTTSVWTRLTSVFLSTHTKGVFVSCRYNKTTRTKQLASWTQCACLQENKLSYR